jgi:hypothetical protein
MINKIAANLSIADIEERRYEMFLLCVDAVVYIEDCLLEVFLFFSRTKNIPNSITEDNDE